MEDSFLASLLYEQINGLIILNNKKEVVYSNKRIQDLFSSRINNLLGDYLLCTHTLLEQVHCQSTTNCTSCIINNILDKLLSTHRTQVLTNINFESNHEIINFSLKASYKEGFLVLEIFDMDEDSEKLHLLARLVESSSDIMIFKDSKLRYKYINKSGASLFNKSPGYILNKTDADLLNTELFDDYSDDDLNKIDKELLSKDLLDLSLNSDLIALEKGKYSNVKFIHSRYFQISKESIDGGVLTIIRDTTDELKATQRAEIDSLTNLYNRRKFTKIISEIYDIKDDGYYIALIDLDDLRSLNNDYGHLKGDNYLTLLGKILSGYSDGTFFRLGGDEFCGLIKGDESQVNKIFLSIFNKLGNLDMHPKLSISVGIKKLDINQGYLYNYDDVDKVLYKAKNSGKNKFILE